MNENVFKFSSYKIYITAQKTRFSAVRGYHGRLAEASQCKSSYLSLVLSGNTHLTPEHALGLCQFWGFSPLETEMFMALVHYERAGNHLLREYLKNQIVKLVENADDVKSKLPVQTINEADVSLYYYSYWLIAAMHVLLSIPGFSETETISRYLNIDSATAREHLEKLASYGVIEKNGNHWKVKQTSIHAAKGSLHSRLHLTNWRQKALEVVGDPIKHSQAFNFTTLYSFSLKDMQYLREQILELIEKYAKRVQSSRAKEEVAACLNIDLFRF